MKMKQAVKYIAIILAGLLLLIVILMLLTQTAFFREKVKNRIVAEAERFLNFNLEIEELNGNLYRNIEFNKVRLLDHGKAVAGLESLKLEYRLFPLLTGELFIDLLVIDSPDIRLKQNSDSTWNISSLLREKEAALPKSKKPLKLRINIDLLEINNGSIKTEALSELIPKEVNALNLSLNAFIAHKDIRVQLDDLNLSALEPSIDLKELSGTYRMNRQGIQIDNLKILTSRSDITAEGNYQELQNLNALAEAGRIDNKELELFVPGIMLLCSPKVYADIKNIDDSISAVIELTHQEESVKANIQLSPFSELFNKNSKVPYSADLFFKNFRIENWIETKDIRSSLEGEVKMNGADFLDPDMFTALNANLAHSSYNNIEFDTLRIDGSWYSDSVKANIVASSGFGKVKGNAFISNIMVNPGFAADFLVQKFDVSAFVPDLRKFFINGRVVAEGSGLSPESMKFNANVNLAQSTVFDFEIDSLMTVLAFQNKEFRLHTLELLAKGARAKGKGRFNLDSLYLDTRVVAHIDSLALARHLFELPLEFDSVNTVAEIAGPVQNLKISGNAEIFNATGYDAWLSQADAKYVVDVDPDSLSVKVISETGKLSYANTHWDSLSVDLLYLNRQIDIKGNVTLKDTLNVEVETRINLGDTLVLTVPDLRAQTLLSDYYFKDTATIEVVAPDKIKVDNLQILDKNNPGFLLSADGNISTSDTNLFRVRINELNLETINRFIQNEDSISGILNSEITLKGSAKNPNIDGAFGLLNPKFGSYSVPALNGKFNYTDQKGFAEISNPEMGDDFYASITAPFNAYIDSLKFIFSEPDTFNATLNLKNIGLAKHVGGFIPNDSINGVLNAQITARGDFNTPQLYGAVNFDKVKYLNKKLGFDFNDLKASVAFNGNKVTIDTVFIRQKNGIFSVSGDLEFDSTIVKGNIISSSLQADANNFYVARNRNFEVLIDANTFLKTGVNNPEFGGMVKVLRSDVYLPALMSKGKTDLNSEDLPMLVQALNEKKDTIVVAQDSTLKALKSVQDKMQLFDKITGRLSVEIPRNTWIRSNDMRLEIRGDVDIVKAGPSFELFGNVEISRGHYILYGKKLNVKESHIIFEGGEKMDPHINFTAEYVFRGSDREKRYLELMVTGKLSEPEIAFRLDKAEVTENDGISVLLFGTTSDEIGFGEQNGLVNSIGSNAVASLLSSKLSRTIGTQLNLDMIEITATDNWKSAAFVVGKYITNDIFVIYERGFGEVDGDEITPETFTVEYELNDKLFLRLQSGSSITSGIDIILKFEQELNK